MEKKVSSRISRGGKSVPISRGSKRSTISCAMAWIVALSIWASIQSKDVVIFTTGGFQRCWRGGSQFLLDTHLIKYVNVSSTFPLPFKSRICVRLVHILAIQIGKPGFDVAHGNKDGDFVAEVTRRNTFLLTSFIHLFLPLLDAVIISIDHHHKNTAAFAYGVQLCWIVIPNELLTCTCVGSRHSIYLAITFFEKYSDKSCVLFVFAEDGYFGAIHGTSPWA